MFSQEFAEQFAAEAAGIDKQIGAELAVIFFKREWSADSSHFSLGGFHGAVDDLHSLFEAENFQRGHQFRILQMKRVPWLDTSSVRFHASPAWAKALSCRAKDACRLATGGNRRRSSNRRQRSDGAHIQLRLEGVEERWLWSPQVADAHLPGGQA